MDPGTFNENIRTRSFAVNSDAEFVRAKYEACWTATVASSKNLNFSGCNFASELSDMSPILEICASNLRVLDLSRNGVWGTLRALSVCKNLETLNLSQCSGLTGPGDAIPDGWSIKLTKLGLRYVPPMRQDGSQPPDRPHHPRGVSDLNPLKALKNLRVLQLCGCGELAGSLEPLQGLTQLTFLNLERCEKLTGDLFPLSPLFELGYLNLSGCYQLVGDLKPIHKLLELTSVNLDKCKNLIGELEFKRAHQFCKVISPLGQDIQVPEPIGARARLDNELEACCLLS